MIITHILEKLRTYMRYRASLRALNELTDRELADIGVTRSSIPDIARTATAA